MNSRRRYQHWLQVWREHLAKLSLEDYEAVCIFADMIRAGECPFTLERSFCEFGPGVTPEAVLLLATREGQALSDTLEVVADAFAPWLRDRPQERVMYLDGAREQILRWAASQLVLLEKLAESEPDRIEWESLCV